MRAKVWRADDPYRKPVWEGDLIETAPNQYRWPDGATINSGTQYRWVMYQVELPERYREVHVEPLAPQPSLWDRVKGLVQRGR